MSEFSMSEMPKPIGERIKSKLQYIFDSFKKKQQISRWKEKNITIVQKALKDKDPEAAKHIQEEFEKKAIIEGTENAEKAWKWLVSGILLVSAGIVGYANRKLLRTI
jgi:hypothetical protein